MWEFFRVYGDEEEEWFRSIFANSKKEEAIQNQYEFFMQRMGGPSLYSQRKGLHFLKKNVFGCLFLLARANYTELVDLFFICSVCNHSSILCDPVQFNGSIIFLILRTEHCKTVTGSI